jgi:selenide,water dikinase
VLVGLDHPDDAGVYLLGDDLALVQTVDFFTPVVDDPYDFGRIAAVNALSDVYAMGAQPITALNVTAYPAGADPGPEVLARILQGGLDVLTAAGVALLGGHTVDDAEPKYGMAVTGIAHPGEIRTKGGALPGDHLLLTKPIGVGAVTTALRRGLLTPDAERRVVDLMLVLNDQLVAVRHAAVHAATDVTGFGLLGHLLEVTTESGVGARIHLGRVPVLDGARAFVEADVVPAGSRKNLAYVREALDVDAAVSSVDLQLLADAVTAGGLLLAVAPSGVEAVAALLDQAGAVTVADIGEVQAAPPGRIAVAP